MFLTETLSHHDLEDRAGGPWGALTNEERTQLIQWNDTRAAFPQVCTHELFELQIDRDPDAIAVAFGDVQLSYRELNERANRVAHHLRGRGVGPNVLVGVCLERSPELLVALLGVWKAGGAYIPLDPTYPKERLSFVIEDAQPLVLLTGKKSASLLPAWGADVVRLDGDWPMLSQERAHNPEPVVSPTDLAYVMYTSGSTGKPKGVMIAHRGLVNYLWWAIRTYGVEPGYSVPVHTSISFDLTVTSLYTTLLGGGTVELLAEDIGAQNLLAALRRAGNRGLVKITPAHLELLSTQIRPDQAADMARVLVIGGENLLAETLRLWRDHAASTRLINEYGPTETVVGCCVHEVQPADPYSGSVPIGRPIANTQLYVLDENMQPVRPGVTGELFIGGVGVGLGYLNRAELTAERFLPDPFASVSGARLYKSGDLARYRSDGTLEYLGRADDQVKIRGYRVELGEIEAAIAADPRVQACAVLACEDEPGNKQLVGYVVHRDGEAPDTDELRGFLKETLPDYMIPAQFVCLDSLPLTPNGKVDRGALPAPADTGSGRGGPPQTETERVIAAIWCELLRKDGIGIDDDFFDLGGQSMTAVGLIGRLRDAFDVSIEIAMLFERPTIAGLAEAIDMLLLTSQGLESVPLGEPRGVQSVMDAAALLATLRARDVRLWIEDTQLKCSAPVGALDAALRETLAGRKQEIIAFLRQAEALKNGPASIVQFNASGDRPAVYFFNGTLVGGHSSMQRIVELLGPDYPINSIDPHGLHGEAIPPSIEKMAADRLPLILERQASGPFLLGGFCNGAVVAFEAARLLMAAGHRVDRVVMVDPPTVNARAAAQAILRPMKRLVSPYGLRSTYQLMVRLEQFFNGSTSKRVSKLYTALTNPKKLHDAVFNPYDTIPRAIWEPYSLAMAQYLPTPLDVPVTFYAADHDGRTWRALSSQLEVIQVPGGHGGCLTIGLERLVAHLRQRMDAVADGVSSTIELHTSPISTGSIGDPMRNET